MKAWSGDRIWDISAYSGIWKGLKVLKKWPDIYPKHNASTLPEVESHLLPYTGPIPYSYFP